MSGFFAALTWSNDVGSISVSRPDSRSITTGLMFAKIRSICSESSFSVGSARPAANSTLRCLSRAALRSWSCLSETAAEETSTAQTTQTAPENRIVYRAICRIAGLSPFDVGLDHEVVDQ